MKGLTNAQWTIAFFCIWLAALLVLWLSWEVSERDFHWWTIVTYAVVMGIATFFSIKITPSLQKSGPL